MQMPRLIMPRIDQLVRYGAVLLIGAIGGGLLWSFGAPMPFLLGGFLATGLAVLTGVKVLGEPLSFPVQLRTAFIVVIGVLIGGSVDGDLLGAFRSSWMSFLAVLAFVLIAQAGNYVIFRRIGGYDRQTAFFGGTPGGLIESITLGEEAGGDARILTIQQFARIILVIMTIPFLVTLWHGSAVGSAAGASFAAEQAGLSAVDWIVLTLTGAIGFVIGKRLKLPAAILTGPVLLSALVHGTGLSDAYPPDLLVNVSQWIIGSGLGMRFAGLDRATLTKALGLAVISTIFMFSVGFALALGLSQFIELDLIVLFIIFAPGGVIEMGLIALSLNANPFFVTLHHLLRIAATVLMGSMMAKRWKRESRA